MKIKDYLQKYINNFLAQHGCDPITLVEAEYEGKYYYVSTTNTTWTLCVEESFAKMIEMSEQILAISKRDTVVIKGHCEKILKDIKLKEIEKI